MKQAISFDAILWDLKKIKNRYSYLLEQYWLVLFFFLVWPVFSFLFNSFSPSFFLLFALFVSFAAISALLLKYFQYKKMKQKEAKGEIIFFQQKTNERMNYLYFFGLFLLLAFSFRNEPFIFLLMSFFAISRFVKFLFYIPSISFIAEGYQLTIIKGRKHKQIDFSYPTSLRFVYNQMVFENQINGKVQSKNTRLNKEKIDRLKHFLAENFGREMVISPSTGQPLT